MLVMNSLEPGGPEVLVPSDVDVPRPRSGEVLIDVAAAGVNNADLLQRAGLYPPPAGAPSWPGLEVSGVVAAAGPDSGWAPGDRVAALLDGGGYAQQAIAPAAQVLPVPDGMDLVDAAALPEAACTVWSTLAAAGLAPGQWLLVHGGSGGVGSLAVQVGAALGAHVIATAGGP